ncbi:MAG: putative Diphosphomevalonate decarboxylase [Promethearchaeota archaeon]|nr:MAG: putative Diphosphomevalonate decarboxylase [Candidatus Lokiarchaeota archaeon]
MEKSMRSSAFAHPNIALVKYWGKSRDHPSHLNIPTNDSVSMTKESINTAESGIDLITHTTIDFSDQYDKDMGFLKSDDDLVPFTEIQMKRILKVVDALRKIAGSSLRFKMMSQNKFPTAAGLASSSSAFAALATCVSNALGLTLDNVELSKYARLGSGSASRSLHGGFVCWNKGDSHDTSYAEQICPCNEFNISAVIAVINRDEKAVSSDIGQETAHTSVFNPVKIREAQKQAVEIKKAIQNDDFTTVGQISEKSCLYMHSVMMTSDPPLFYWNPNTLKVIKAVVATRNQFLHTYKTIKKGIDQKEKDGIECYFTVDAGPNIHCLCRTEDLDEVQLMLQGIGIPEKNTVRVRQADYGSKVVDQHLF